MKQKRTNAATNNQQPNGGVIGVMSNNMRGVAERDNSNDPYENGGNPQRTDTGGGDYMHQAVEDEICYNNRFSPKATANAKLSIPGG